jgi:hypothetical protein
LRGLCWIGTPRAPGKEEDQGRPGVGQLWKKDREKEGRGGRCRGGQRTEVAGKASWKPFAPTRETIGNDDDDDDDDDDEFVESQPTLRSNIYLWLYSPLLELRRLGQFRIPIHSRLDFFDGGPARRKAATYT